MVQSLYLTGLTIHHFLTSFSTCQAFTFTFCIAFLWGIQQQFGLGGSIKENALLCFKNIGIVIKDNKDYKDTKTPKWLSEVLKPARFLGRVHWGKGKGELFQTLANPYPWPGVEGIPANYFLQVFL